MEQKDIRELAELSRLSLTDEEIVSYQKDFEGILGYIDTLKRVSVSESTRTDEILVNVVREDDHAYAPGEFSEALLSVAPRTQDNYIKVPKIL